MRWILGAREGCEGEISVLAQCCRLLGEAQHFGFVDCREIACGFIGMSALPVAEIDKRFQRSRARVQPLTAKARKGTSVSRDLHHLLAASGP
jgi:hypothetical protein